jgi:hypothetical protein
MLKQSQNYFYGAGSAVPNWENYGFFEFHSGCFGLFTDPEPKENPGR